MIDMGANTLTVVVGGVGVLCSAIFPYYFYWLGGRKAKAQNSELRSLISLLVQQRISDRSPASSGAVQLDAPRSGVAPPSDALADSVLSDAALEELVRASLGALLNERGEVEMTRLLGEVGAVLGPSHMSDALSALRRLRAKGVVSWDDGDDDMSRVRTVRVVVVQRPA
jgi:hypothetical protein